ncbi:MAG: PTS glucose transporter subunit IIA [Campylobacterota bacterium]|nr:PTS glucose transporter subunit IIA [Campylobacterota bacterium]
MFGLFKAKSIEIVSPVTGEAVALESVNDEVFSRKMLGDGVAVIPTDGVFGAPFDGIISKIFSTHHAYTVKHKKGLEVIVHIGLDTVNLKGEGFTAVASEGEAVKAGDTIIRADLAKIKSLGKEIITPVIVTEESSDKPIEKKLGKTARGELLMEVE